MSQDILKTLENSPERVFKLFTTGRSKNGDYFKQLVKSLIDPIARPYSVLDEIYIDGLDSDQVYGQTKMVLDGVTEKILFEKIPDLKETLHSESEDERESDEQAPNSDIQNSMADVEEKPENYNINNEILEFEDENSNLMDNSDDESEVQDDQEVDRSETVDNSAISQTNRGGFNSKEHKRDVFGLNDGFFDIDEFNKQTLALEDVPEDPSQNQDEEIDYFADLNIDGSEEEVDYFDDFYDNPPKEQSKDVFLRKTGDNEESVDEFEEKDYEDAMSSARLDLFADDHENDTVDEKKQNMSSYEKEQQKIQEEIKELEAELIADKKWTMKGEITSKDRPEDSLLNDIEASNLDFERNAKPVPVITEEVTETIEDLIRRRIKNDEFDDLPKRLVTDVSKFYNKQKLELSEQKSSKSLSEIYEDEYNQVDPQQHVNEQLQKEHNEIKELFTKVSYKLDSLASAHFIPKPHEAKSIEIKVNDDAPVISMEDSQPLNVPTSGALAPQEIYKIGDDKSGAASGVEGRSEVLLKSGLSYSKGELSRDEKQRLRRANKRKKSKEFNKKRELRQEIDNQSNSQQYSEIPKRQKVGKVMDTLSKAKNVTVIDKKGDLRDVKGNLKSQRSAQSSNNLKL